VSTNFPWPMLFSDISITGQTMDKKVHQEQLIFYSCKQSSWTKGQLNRNPALPNVGIQGPANRMLPQCIVTTNAYTTEFYTCFNLPASKWCSYMSQHLVGHLALRIILEHEQYGMVSSRENLTKINSEEGYYLNPRDTAAPSHLSASISP
jgi:hypothetical protein